METKSINPQEQQDEEMQLIPLLKLCYHQFINHWAWSLYRPLCAVA